MADERVFYAGDLSSDHLESTITLQNDTVSLTGKLLKVEHSVSSETKKPVTYVLVDGSAGQVGNVLRSEWKVLVQR